MPTIAQTPDVLARVRTAIDVQAREAAGTNGLISRDEQAALPSDFLKRQADAIRAAGGAGTRVTVDALVTTSSDEVARLLGQVNQPSGQGAHSVSRAEVQALAALDAEVGALVAAAYELLTGRSAELDGAAPVDPPTPPAPAPVGKLTVTSAVIAPAGRSHLTQQATIRPDGAIALPRAAEQPSTITIEAAGRTIVASVPTNETMSGAVQNQATPADVIEAIRKAAPDLFVHVTTYKSSEIVIELWNTPPPKQTPPVYMFAQMRDAAGAKVNGLELRGPKTFVCGNYDIAAGTTMSLRLDDVVYTATAGASERTGDLMRRLRDQVEAAGSTVVLREYARIAPWTFRIVD